MFNKICKKISYWKMFQDISSSNKIIQTKWTVHRNLLYLLAQSRCFWWSRRLFAFPVKIRLCMWLTVILSRGRVNEQDYILQRTLERSRISRAEIINVRARWRFRHNSRRHFSRFSEAIYFKHFKKEVAVGRYCRTRTRWFTSCLCRIWKDELSLVALYVTTFLCKFDPIDKMRKRLNFLTTFTDKSS